MPVAEQMTSSLAYITAEVPGIGGKIKQREDDFFVQEEPLYEPGGSGEHLYLFIEKHGQTTTDVVRRLAKMFKVPRSAVGYAGLKDKRAVTRQHFSIHRPDPADDEKFMSRIEFTPFRLLWADRHTNKLKRGHLKGNRFDIRLRDVNPADVLHAQKTLERLATVGVPDFLGNQRFGYRQENHLLGRDLLLGRWQDVLDRMLGDPRPTDSPPFREGREAYERGDYLAALQSWPKQLRHDRQALDALRQGKSPREAVEAIEWHQREFVICSFQSAVFNKVLDRRIRDGLFDRLVEGDVAWKHDSRATFHVDAETAELENGPEGRVRRLEISPSGPMWGPKMTNASGAPGQWEREALESEGITEAQWMASPYAAKVEGRRRPMRAILHDPEASAGADEHGPFIRVAFMLPRGSFATIVLREIMKPDPSETQP